MNFEILNSIEGRKSYLDYLKSKLLFEENWEPIVLSREWAKTVTKASGVYVIRHESDLIYVGESGNLSERMLNLLDSRNHTLRRSLGKRYFADHIEYTKASSSIRYAQSIETLINNFITTKLSIAFLEVYLGRKELEEYIVSTLEANFCLNSRIKRKTN